MATRAVLLVGSMPFDDEAACMTRALDTVGPYLFCLPDGEVGEKTTAYPTGTRSSWINYAIERLHADSAHWRVVTEAVRGNDGYPVNYASFQKLAPRFPPAALPTHVSFGYDAFFRQSYPAFKRMRNARGLHSLRFQVGMPTASALNFIFTTPEEGVPYRDAFNAVFAREINAMVAEAGDDVVIQIEVPPELYAAYAAPALMDTLALRPVFELLEKIAPGARIGVHLCLGDFHNTSIVHPDTLRTMVEFSNRLVAGWPRHLGLEYVHYPLAEGQVPPTTDSRYYAPLADIVLPPSTRFVAGFVHERLPYDENRALLHAVESRSRRRVDVACSCGLGRRTPTVANALLGYMARLAQD